MNGALEEYLRDIETKTQEMLSQLVKQFAENDGITEQSKADNHTEWHVGWKKP